MDISNIIFENRPRLQCVNVFISFTKNFKSVEAVQLSVQTEKVTIELEELKYSINFAEHFTFHTQTLSQLIIKKNYISFRVNTNQANFETELLQIQNLSLNNNDDFKLLPNIKSGDEQVITCSNCCNLFTKLTFNRILELPSENLEMADWFCHKHGEGHSSEFVDETGGENSKQNHSKFKPGTGDAFYGNFFVLLNTGAIQNVRSKGKLTYCKRCLQYLGHQTSNKSHDTVKLWNDTVKFSSSFFFTTNGLVADFTLILRRVQQDFTFEALGMPQLMKAIVETTLSNGKQNFLLLQIMDKNLEMLRNMKPNKNEVAGEIQLEKCHAIKLLFKYEENGEQPMVKFWLGNTHINSIQISPQMFKAVATHLNSMSTLIAECYRTSYGFSLSYLDI